MKKALSDVIDKRDLQHLAIWWGLSKKPNFWTKTPTETALAFALHRHAQRLLSTETEDAPFLDVHRAPAA